jgi:hypothetical protein
LANPSDHPLVKQIHDEEQEIEALESKIQAADLKRTYPLQVTRRSPLRLRKVVERFAIYFMREFDYPIQQFHARENGGYTAYLLTGFRSRRSPVWAGACCFRPESFADRGYGETLRWIWLHPYCRTKGILTEIWPALKENHGDFFVEPPLSTAMLISWSVITVGRAFIRCIKSSQHEPNPAGGSLGTNEPHRGAVM